MKTGAELGPCQVSGGGGLNPSCELPHLCYLSALGASLERELIPAPLVKTRMSDGLSGLITNALNQLFHVEEWQDLCQKLAYRPNVLV